VKRPNLFIVGAPKCGTSSLHNYLDQHPQIFMTQQTKEPAYFCTDLRVNESRRTRDTHSYLALFAEARQEKCLGESTVWNLCSRAAARDIQAWDPAAKIIIMLRNPVDAMYSLHGQFLWSCNEDIVDFEQALAAEDDRHHGRRIPPEAHSPDGLLYTRVFSFAEQVARYYGVFPPDQIKVIIFDDFVKDTARVYRETLEFLGVDPAFQATLEVVNPAKPAPLAFNRFFARRPALRSAVHRFMPAALKRKLMELVPRLTPTVDRPTRIDPELRGRLLPRFAADVEQLSKLLNQDLTHWCGPS